MKWQEVVIQEGKKAEMNGGEVSLVFIARGEKRIPVIKTYIDNKIVCDETVIIDDD